MKMLLLILSVMTLTVESKSKVSSSGDVPEGMAASYACTYQKGDVRAGDTATLSISGLKGIALEQIEVYVKSNKTAGAGKFTVAANGEAAATKEGSFKDWTGAYDNSEYHAIELLSSSLTNVNSLSVELAGTANSLHIEKYVITYGSSAPHAVTLMADGTELDVLTEKAGGAGVKLPAVDDKGEWLFAGWSETEFWEICEPPAILPAATYYPQEDCTLWAVYEQNRTPAVQYETELSDGLYMYVNNKVNKALSGVPENGKMESKTIDPYDDEQQYMFTFPTDSTATIVYAKDNIPIGYTADGKMAVKESVWNVYHNGEETYFYASIGENIYVLWLTIQENDYVEEVYAGLLKVYSLFEGTPMRLLSTLVPAPLIAYTCHPLQQGIENTNEMTNRRMLMQFGNYELILKNGKKYLELR